MKRATLLTSIVGSGLAAMAIAQTQASLPAGPNVAKIEKVKENLYMITGGGGNTAAYVTAKGVVLVDTKLANWGQAILDQVKTVTDKPVTHLINTHTHGDHVGSNEFFPASVEIVAHENTDANMKKMPAFADPAKKYALADMTFKTKVTLLSGNDAVDLFYFGRGHTDGDAFVLFRAAKTVHAGDIFARKGTPLLDMNNGGSGLEIGDTLAKAAAGIKDFDTVIPGHSTLMKPADLVEFSEFNKAFLAAVQDGIRAGKTAEQTAADLKLPEKFAAYTMTGAKDNVAKIYAELGK
jgi:cyclase